MSGNVSIIAVTEIAVFFGMKNPVDECLVYDINVEGSSFVIVNAEYYGHRLPFDDVNRLYNINKPLAMEIYELVKSEHPEHPVCGMFINEIEELIDEDDGK